MADRLRSRLLDWYDENKRDLPWRQTRDPYGVWISEVMLQQTTVGVVVPYYERWMRRFPSVQSLAASSEQDVLAIWQGLGYYRRAKNVRKAAVQILADGGFPTSFEGWIRIPGVGAYTAGAICAICLGHETPAIDGNVQRVYSRLHADGTYGSNKSCQTWAAGIVAGERPGDLIQALMELGSEVCRPRDPFCGTCPLRRECVAKKQGDQLAYPPRKPRREMKHVESVIVVPVFEGKFGVRQIPPGEWNEGMYAFDVRAATSSTKPIGRFTHAITNHRLNVSVFLKAKKSKGAGFKWYTSEELKGVPMPAHQRRAARLALNALAQREENSRGRTTSPEPFKK